MRAIEDVLTDSVPPAARAMVNRLANFLAWGVVDLDVAERVCEEARSLFEGRCPVQRIARRERASLDRRTSDEYPAMQAVAEYVVASAELAGDRFATIQALTVLDRVVLSRSFRGSRSPAPARYRTRRTRRKGVPADHEPSAPCLLTRLRGTACGSNRSRRRGQQTPDARDAPAGVGSDRPVVRRRLSSGTRELAVRRHPARRRTRERRALGVAFAALAAVEADQPAQARDHLRRVRGALDGIDFLCAGFAAGHAEALLDWHEGRASEALVRLTNVATDCDAVGAAPFTALILLDLAELAAELGDAEAAENASRRLRAIADEIDRDLYHALAAMAAGWSSSAGGAPDRSAEAARNAVELLASSDCRGFLARAREQLAQALFATDIAAAREALHQATTAFRSSGALWRLRRARELKREIYGRRPQRCPATISAHGRERSRVWPSPATPHERSARNCSSAPAQSKHTWRMSTPTRSARSSNSSGARRISH